MLKNILMAIVAVFTRFLGWCSCRLGFHKWTYYADCEGGGLDPLSEFKLNSVRICDRCPKEEEKHQNVDFCFYWEDRNGR